MNSGIDLDAHDFATVLKILQEHIPQYEVRAFGSRVTGTAKKFSDLDLVIMSKTPLPLLLLGDLADAFSESDLPIKVDLLDWSRIDEGFQKLILQKYIRLQ